MTKHNLLLSEGLLKGRYCDFPRISCLTGNRLTPTDLFTLIYVKPWCPWVKTGVMNYRFDVSFLFQLLVVSYFSVIWQGSTIQACPSWCSVWWLLFSLLINNRCAESQTHEEKMPMPTPRCSKTAGVSGPCHIDPAVVQEKKMQGFFGHDLNFMHTHLIDMCLNIICGLQTSLI